MSFRKSGGNSRQKRLTKNARESYHMSEEALNAHIEWHEEDGMNEYERR